MGVALAAGPPAVVPGGDTAEGVRLPLKDNLALEHAGLVEVAVVGGAPGEVGPVGLRRHHRILVGIVDVEGGHERPVVEVEAGAVTVVVVDFVDHVGLDGPHRQAVGQPVVAEVEAGLHGKVHLQVAVLGLPVRPGPPGVEANGGQRHPHVGAEEGVDPTVQVDLRDVEAPEVRLRPGRVVRRGHVERRVSRADHGSPPFRLAMNAILSPVAASDPPLMKTEGPWDLVPGRQGRGWGPPVPFAPMRLATVVGQVVATVKEPGLDGFKILLVEDVDPSHPDSNGFGAYLAVDLVGAGEGEVVVIAMGSAARIPEATDSHIDRRRRGRDRRQRDPPRRGDFQEVRSTRWPYAPLQPQRQFHRQEKQPCRPKATDGYRRVPSG